MTRKAKWIVSAVLVALCVFGVVNRYHLLPDDRVRSYAFVSGCACRHVGDYHYCDFAFRVPAAPLASRPDGPHPELRHGGTVVRYSDERDPLWGCDEIDQTWLPVRYPSDAPADASIDLPIGSGSWFLAISFGVLALWHVCPPVFGRLRRWRRARRDRR